MRNVLRSFFAFVAILAFSASALASFSPSSQYRARDTTTGAVTAWYPSQSPACDAAFATFGLAVGSWTSTKWAPPGYSSSCAIMAGTTVSNTTRIQMVGPTTACPINSTGTTSCTCNTGWMQEGNACVVQKTENEIHCKSSGDALLTRGVTGTTGGTVPAQTCFVTDPPFPGEEGKGCLMDMGDSVIVPLANGTRAFSAVGKYTGAPCTPAVDPVLGDPRPTQEDKCPGGFLGTVNGVSRCIASEPDKGVTGIKTTTNTNPDGSTTTIKEETKCTGEQCTTTRTQTNTPAGGGTATVTVSGTTQSMADKCHTDPTNAVCTKTGTTPSTQNGGTNPDGTGTEEGGGECGVAGKPACNVKVDETGTPNVGTTFDAAKGELDTNKGAVQEQINAAASIQAPSWSFSFQLPTGCTSYQVGGGAIFKGVGFTMNPCTYQSTIHDLMSMIWAAVTAFCIIQMVGRTIREA